MKVLLKIIRFIYLVLAYSILAILYPVNYLLKVIFKYEMMFLFNWNDYVIEKINDKIDNF